ncbi:vegetative cell wall protein gp1-like [Vigna umbellata]|uniref:vegetative cell wall protein gp1-like n=1 Tax=Vigna umbellata TaxID=87088 RepID=UPI001F5ED83F|nr:vegetative cell wall protein gp1-like [Vigna umbellata]
MANPSPAAFSALLLLLSFLVNIASAGESPGPAPPPEFSPSSPPRHSPSPHVAPPSHNSPSEPPQSPSPAPSHHDSPPVPPPQENPSPSPASSPSPDAADDGGVNHADLAGHNGKSSSEGMSSGKKAGIALGVIVGAGVVVLGAVVYKKRRQNMQRSQYGYAARRELL